MAVADEAPQECMFCGRQGAESPFRPYYDGFACTECRASIMVRRVGAFLFDCFVVAGMGGSLLSLGAVGLTGYPSAPSNAWGTYDVLIDHGTTKTGPDITQDQQFWRYRTAWRREFHFASTPSLPNPSTPTFS